MSKPNVSVIIPALNEAANIQVAVESAVTSGAFEIIVVDGGSTDGTLEIAKSAGAKVVTSSPGRAIQQNTGAAQATGDVLLFLHADCRLATASIPELQSHFSGSQDHSQFGAFKQAINDRSTIYRWIEWGNNLRVRWPGLPYGDQGIWIARELFERGGGFADVQLMEDVKLGERMRAHGRPALLNGPIHVGARRWQQSGPIRQTLRNWSIMLRYKLGVSPNDLVKSYPQHDT